MTGPRHFRCGVLTVVILVGVELRGQSSAARILPAPIHSISPEIRGAVIEKLPKYSPPPPKVPEPPHEEASDSSGILRLPKITVKERPPTPPDSFDLLTPKGRLDLALKSRPGLRVGNLFGLNNGIALAMQAEERALEKKTALADTIRRTTSESSPERKKLMRQLKDAAQRPNDDWATYSGPMK